MNMETTTVSASGYIQDIIGKKSFAINSSARQLMAKARELAGIPDIVDAEVQEALECALHSINTEANLNLEGALAMERRILRLLCNRLRMLRDFQAHPEIDEQQIVRPLIIPGIARAGSTKLHKMLAASGDFKYMKYWQGHSMSLRSGDRDEDPAPRIAEADEFVRWFNRQNPQAYLTHEYSTFEPEEETLVLEHCASLHALPIFAFMPTFMVWAASQDFADKFAFVKQGMKYLQWQFYDGDTRPWIFKSPYYAGSELLLKEIFPDAVFVPTHRRPADVVSSLASLVRSYYKGYSDIDPSRQLGPLMLEFQAMGTESYVQGCAAHPELEVLDIAYVDICKNAEEVIERIYVHAGMTLSDNARQKMIAWEKQNHQHKLGVHKYSLEDFALTEEMVNTRMASYIKSYGHYF